MKKITAVLCNILAIASLAACEEKAKSAKENAMNAKTEIAYDGIFSAHEAYGTGIGAMPGRVVWAHDPDAVFWDGRGYWWETNHFDESRILRMLNESIAALGGKDSAKAGWSALFTAHNGGSEYHAGEKIAIKVNMNGSAVFDNDTSGKTHMGYANAVLLKAMLRSLVEEAGVSPADITVYDVSRLFPNYHGRIVHERQSSRSPFCRARQWRGGQTCADQMVAYVQRQRKLSSHVRDGSEVHHQPGESERAQLRNHLVRKKSLRLVHQRK